MKHTLTSTPRINWLFAHGERLVTPRVLALFSRVDTTAASAAPGTVPIKEQEPTLPQQNGSVAFIAGKKIGNAPIRSRAKRRLRAAAALQGAPWPGHDVILVARKAVLSADFATLERDLVRLTKKLGCAQTLPSTPARRQSPRSSLTTSPAKARNLKTSLPPAQAREPRTALTAQTHRSRDRRIYNGRNPSREGLEALPPMQTCHLASAMRPAHVKLKTSLPAQAPRPASVTQSASGTPKAPSTVQPHGFIFNIPRNLALLCITIYQHAVSPLFPPSCRYVPTCSEYAATAFQRFGFTKGLWLSVRRVGRCHPFCVGGWDPVPERFSSGRNKRAVTPAQTNQTPEMGRCHRHKHC
jgi:putative membrane protein insertion efficiency factor/ribonuclease P protein component